VWGFHETFLFSLYLCYTNIRKRMRGGIKGEWAKGVVEHIGDRDAILATKGIIGLLSRARATTCAGEKRFMLFSPCVGLIRLPTLIHFCWPYTRLIRQPILIQCLYFSIFFVFFVFHLFLSISRFPISYTFLLFFLVKFKRGL
jgi:hypothetical protein